MCLNKGRLLAAGYGVATVMALAIMLLPATLWTLIVIYAIGGVYVAMEETLEDSFCAELVGEAQHGMAFGTLATVNGLGTGRRLTALASVGYAPSALLAKALHASPLIAGIVNVRARRYIQSDTGRIFPPESSLTFPVVASGVQIAVRGYLNRHACLGPFRKSSFACPLIAGAHQKSVGRQNHGCAPLPVQAITAFAFPTDAVG